MEWFVGPVMEKIIDAGFEYLKDQVRWQTGMKDELQRLREIHPKIQAVVCAANQAQIEDQNPALNKWLWELRDAIDDAEDVLDEFEYLKHGQKLTKITKQIKVRSLIISIKKRLVQVDPNLKRLEEVVQKLDKVSADVGNFLHLLNNTILEQQEQQLELHGIRETGAFPINSLIGRCEEMEFIMQWLRKTSNEHHQTTHITGTTFYNNISLLSIVGHGGMGKTTLLQHVYKNTRANEFDLKMWVSISTNFDPKRVIADMLECLKKERPRLETLHMLQESLKSELMSKNFLLVLDDVWEKEEEKDKSKWENVLAPLMAYGSLGSKILVTTRLNSVASMFAKILIKKEEESLLRLGGLNEDECFQILKNYAFPGVGNPDDHRISIMRQIVKKLLGSPLATKVIGGVLSSNMDERHWRKVLDSEFGSVSQNFFLPILRLSYIFLPKHLQSCFSFCSIFPQGHKYNKYSLIRMWIAVGFIQPSSNTKETLEDIGESYFDILVKKSFFDKFQDAYETCYKMHDLLHELAQLVSAHECFRVVDNEELSIPEAIRHLFVQTGKVEVLRKIKKIKYLRSLFLLCDDYNNQDLANVLSEIFKTSRSIRLLFIKAKCKMPEVIGDLIHLRYLEYYDNYNTTQLPRSISKLYHMHFMIFNSLPTFLKKRVFVSNDELLPRDMNNLFNLRYLDVPEVLVKGIGKLHSLQNLNMYFVRNESGYKIDELKHMNELHKLSIYQLENVKDFEEACNAKFCDKSKLTELSLHWADHVGYRNIVRPDLDETVFDSLKPHNNLKQLTIKAYRGTRSAIWMSDVNLCSNLEYIKLDDCLEWQTLPAIWQLPFLKSLYLCSMPKVKSLYDKFHRNDKDRVFPSLEVLHIENLEALEDWFDAAAAETKECLFPCLTELWLTDCAKLQELPSLPPKLQDLRIVNTGWKAFNWLQDASNCCSMYISYNGSFFYRNGNDFIQVDLEIIDPSILLMDPFRSITSVRRLEFSMIDKLVSFPFEIEQWFLQVSSSLRVLKFEDLKSLQSLPSVLESLSSLEDLSVIDGPQLLLLPNFPASLQGLYLENLRSLQYLPSSLLAISSFKHLDLNEIPHLKSLPDLPSSLEVLCLCDLESLQCLPSSLSGISSLRKLDLSNMPLLTSLPDLPPSLRELRLSCLDNLNCLPSCFSSLSSLQILDIHSVPRLRELPDLPPSLYRLSITNCHPKLKEHYEKFRGSDWHKIALIPHVEFWDE